MPRDFSKYGINIGTATQGTVRTICPFCSETRKHHRQEKCLSVHIQLGLYHCFHCGESGYVPTDDETLRREEQRTQRKNRGHPQKEFHNIRPPIEILKKLPLRLCILHYKLQINKAINNSFSAECIDSYTMPKYR